MWLHSVHSELHDRNYVCQSALIQVYIYSPILNIFNIFGSHLKKKTIIHPNYFLKQPFSVQNPHSFTVEWVSGTKPKGTYFAVFSVFILCLEDPYI